ncbi:MAG: hypothetical protein GY703_10455 [Gammaproteobacteria bacterium]|nr:hypothetical protein [Gammaproteobacteria bacterium]
MPKWSDALKVGEAPWVKCASTVDACENDCVVYYNAPLHADPNRERQLADAKVCPVCKNNRAQKSKPFIAFDIGVQLAGQWSRPDLVDMMIPDPSPHPHGVVSSVQQSPRWREKILSDSLLTGSDPLRRYSVVDLFTDGVELLQHDSAWIFAFQNSLLPDGMRSLSCNLLLGGIVPHNKPKTQQAYLGYFVDQLHVLRTDGTPAVDCRFELGDPRRRFTLRATLARCFGDNPALREARALSAGKQPCDAVIPKLELFGGTVYGCFRRFLPLDHPLRTDPRFEHEETRPSPPPKDHDYYMSHYTFHRNVRRAGNQIIKSRKDQIRYETGVLDFCALSRIWNQDMGQDFPSDSRHIISGEFKRHMFQVFKGQRIPQQRKDDAKVKARAIAETKATGKTGEDSESDGGAVSIPWVGKIPRHVSEEVLRHRRWMLSKQYQSHCDWLYCRITHPTSWNIKRSHPLFLRTGKVDMVEWRTFARRGLGKYLFWHCWHDNNAELYSAWCGMLDAAEAFTRHENTHEQLDEMFELVVRALSEMERVSPVREMCDTRWSFQTIVKSIHAWGPSTGFHSFGMERFLGWLKHMARNRHRSAATIAAQYVRKLRADVLLQANAQHLDAKLSLVVEVGSDDDSSGDSDDSDSDSAERKTIGSARKSMLNMVRDRTVLGASRASVSLRRVFWSLKKRRNVAVPSCFRPHLSDLGLVRALVRALPWLRELQTAHRGSDALRAFAPTLLGLLLSIETCTDPVVQHYAPLIRCLEDELRRARSIRVTVNGARMQPCADMRSFLSRGRVHDHRPSFIEIPGRHLQWYATGRAIEDRSHYAVMRHNIAFRVPLSADLDCMEIALAVVMVFSKPRDCPRKSGLDIVNLSDVYEQVTHVLLDDVTRAVVPGVHPGVFFDKRKYAGSYIMLPV